MHACMHACAHGILTIITGNNTVREVLMKNNTFFLKIFLFISNIILAIH